METSAFTEALGKAVLTYHALFGVPIKEANWESILSQTAEACDVRCDWSPGSHVSGVDIALAGKTFSCKSARRNMSAAAPPATIAISSYRLTKSSGSAAALVKEIDVVRANYDAYALLLRESRNRDGGGERIDRYKVYSIPAEALKAGALDWTQTEKGDWIGAPPPEPPGDAESESDDESDDDGDATDAAGRRVRPPKPAPRPPVPYTMKIVKTMSCQLWITVPMHYIEPYLVCEIDMTRAKRINMVGLYDAIYGEAAVAPAPLAAEAEAAEPEGAEADAEDAAEEAYDARLSALADRIAALEVAERGLRGDAA